MGGAAGAALARKNCAAKDMMDKTMATEERARGTASSAVAGVEAAAAGLLTITSSVVLWAAHASVLPLPKFMFPVMHALFVGIEFKAKNCPEHTQEVPIGVW